MPAKFDVPHLNLKAHDLFDTGRAFFVRNPEGRKEAEEKIAEIVKLAAEANEALSGNGLTHAETKEVTRAVEKLGIAKNFFAKTLGAFTSVEDNKKRAEADLAKRRKEKDGLIAKRAKEMEIRNENRKKKEISDLKLKAKEKAEAGL